MSRQIAPAEWAKFFDTFSRHYRGQPIDVQILGEHLGAFAIMRGQPLMGITAQMKKAPCEIEVMAGDTSVHVSHVIKAPSEIWMQQGNNGDDLALKIQSTDGTCILVQFQPCAAKAEGGTRVQA